MRLDAIQEGCVRQFLFFGWRDQMLLRLGLFGAALSGLSGAAWAEPRPGHNAPVSGFYAGVFAGAAVLDSTVDLPANGSSPGGRVVDQGGDGAVFALRAGWGTLISQHVYAGLEVEAFLPVNVDSRYSVNGTRYSMQLDNEIGAYARLGWSPNGVGLLFLRAGLGFPLGSSEASVVPVIGAGAEVPIGQRFAGRVDISHAFPHGESRIESYRLTAGPVMRF